MSDAGISLTENERKRRSLQRRIPLGIALGAAILAPFTASLVGRQRMLVVLGLNGGQITVILISIAFLGVGIALAFTIKRLSERRQLAGSWLGLLLGVVLCCGAVVGAIAFFLASFFELTIIHAPGTGRTWAVEEMRFDQTDYILYTGDGAIYTQVPEGPRFGGNDLPSGIFRNGNYRVDVIGGEYSLRYPLGKGGAFLGSVQLPSPTTADR